MFDGLTFWRVRDVPVVPSGSGHFGYWNEAFGQMKSEISLLRQRIKLQVRHNAISWDQ